MGRKRVNDVVIVHTAWQNKLEGASNMSETRAEQTQDTRVELPMVLTVAELIKVLRISKGAAYAQREHQSEGQYSCNDLLHMNFLQCFK